MKTDKETTINKICTLSLLAFLILTFLYIVILFIVKNIVFERMGIYNGFVKFWLPKEITQALDGNRDTDVKSTYMDWASLYPFEEGNNKPDDNESTSKNLIILKSSIERYTHIVEVTESKVDDYTNKLLPIQQPCANAKNELESLIEWEMTIPKSGQVIFMDNGYLGETCPPMNASSIYELADSVSDFNTFLKEMDIPLLYTNAGSCVCPDDRQTSLSAYEYSNENADALLAALEERGVSTLDFRQEMINQGLDWYRYYYPTDHHWTNIAGLWAASTLVHRLNADYGFSFDETMFDLNSYDVFHYENYWLGSRGRKVTLAKTSLDDYDIIIPKFNTNLTITDKQHGLDKTGDYSDAILKMDVFRLIANYKGDDYYNKQDAYGCINTSIRAQETIHNNLITNNQGKRILFLRDSFANYLLTYVACDVETVDVVGMVDFTGSIRSYIKETKPDMVVIVHNINEINPISFSGHDHYLDYR